MTNNNGLVKRVLGFLIPDRAERLQAHDQRQDQRGKVAVRGEDSLRVDYTQTRSMETSKRHWLEHKIIAWDKTHPVTARLDILRTLILRKMETNGWRTLAIVSPNPGSGKSFLATNMAISLAQNPNKSVMLVDLDLRRPQVAVKLGLETINGSLVDYLAGEAKLTEVLVNPGVPRLVVAPVIKGISNASELLSQKIVANMIQEMRDRYDERIVLFDLPPLLSADDALIVLPNVDCCLLVLGDGEHTAADIEDSMRLLGDTPLLGMVVNRSKAISTDEGY